MGKVTSKAVFKVYDQQQIQLLPPSLDELVPAQHLVRVVHQVVAKCDLRFELDLTSIFDVYPVINMKALSNRLGMNYTLVAQYASGKKKPSPKQAEKIVEGIHDIGRELTELQLVAH